MKKILPAALFAAACVAQAQKDENNTSRKK
jgi:hypothetical protein